MPVISLLKGPGVLEGPYAEITIGERHLELFTKPGCKDRLDGRVHGKLLRHAAEQWTPGNPNPCLVPLDAGDENGGPYGWGRITVNEGNA